MESDRRRDSLDYLPPEGSYSGLAMGAFASLLIAVFSAVMVVSIGQWIGLEMMIPVMVLVPVGSLGALAAGLAALDSIDRRPDITRGRWMARVGIWGGGVLCVVECLIVLRA